MSKLVQSLDHLQKNRDSNSLGGLPEEIPSKDSLFSKFGILLWLGASISATVFSYHLGVSQGIQAVKTESPKEWLHYFSEFSSAATVKPLPQTALVQKAPVTEPLQAVVPAPPKEPSLPAAAPTKKQGFTIQVITYMSDRLAKEEVARLSKKGHKAFVLPSGKYFQVCIDLFEQKKLALKKLTQLRSDRAYKTAYPGAYIKFLKQ